MRYQWLSYVATLLLVAGVTTSARAQQQSESQGTSQNLDQLAEDSEELLEKEAASLSNSEKLERAEQKIQESKKVLQDTRSLLKKATSEEEDVIKINCINDKLAAIKGFLKVSEQSYVKLEEAIDGGDTEAANHQYKLVAISAQKIAKLDEEAGLCVGEVQRYAEGTVVEMEVENQLPDDPEYLTQEPTESGALPELTPVQ
jgi:hypothetical protein